MKERFVIIIIAIVAGLFITSAGFFIYQATKKPADENISTNINASPTETPENSLYIKITEPADELITNKRTLQIKGSTNRNNTVIVSTNQEDVTGKPTNDGEFSITIEIDAGANIVTTRAISPSGDSVEDKRTITYSSEEF